MPPGKSRGKQRPDRESALAARRGGVSGRSGASESSTVWRDRLYSYLQHHGGNCAEALRRLARAPVQSLMTAMVIAIALALPAALYVLVLNLQQLGGSVQASSQVTIFLRSDAQVQAIEPLLTRLRGMPGAQAVTYLSPEEALREFQELSGFGDALTLLDENPLPPVILITPGESLRADFTEAERWIQGIAADPLVDDIQLDMKWLQRLHSVLDIGRRLAFALGVVLSLGVLLVVGNTIRLAIESRRDEIVVVKLVGGTNAYVRRPFLYTGLWYGASGGILAWLLVAGGLWWLAEPIARLAALYQSQFALQGLGVSGFAALPALGAVLGLVGAWLAVSRHAAHIDAE